MDTVRESSATGLSVTVRKTAYCDVHTPQDSDCKPKLDDVAALGISTPKNKARTPKKLADQSPVPVLFRGLMNFSPQCPWEKVQEIASLINVQRKNQFFQRLMAYWTLKRQTRNGVPLIRRLQFAKAMRPDKAPETPQKNAHHSKKKKEIEKAMVKKAKDEFKQMLDQRRLLRRLRQDLERVRLLCELIRKREQRKRELTINATERIQLKCWPFIVFLRDVMDSLQAIDTQEIFAEPVSAEDVPDYYEHIKKPMDFQTMRQKLDNFEYLSLDLLEEDFSVMVDNCLSYNERDTIFFRMGVKMRDQGGSIIRQARRQMEVVGYDPETGTHTADRKTPPKEQVPDEVLMKEIDSFMNSNQRDQLPDEVHLKKLLDLQDKANCLHHPVAKVKRIKALRTEITKIRRKLTLGSKEVSSPAGAKSANKKAAAAAAAVASSAAADLSTLAEEAVDTLEKNVQQAGGNRKKKKTPASKKDEDDDASQDPSSTSGTPATSRRSRAAKEEEEEETATSSSIKKGPAGKKAAAATAALGRKRARQASESKNNEVASSSLPSGKKPKQDEPKTPAKNPSVAASNSLSPTKSPAGVNRRNAVLFTRKKNQVSSQATGDSSSKKGDEEEEEEAGDRQAQDEDDDDEQEMVINIPGPVANNQSDTPATKGEKETTKETSKNSSKAKDPTSAPTTASKQKGGKKKKGSKPPKGGGGRRAITGGPAIDAEEDEDEEEEEAQTKKQASNSSSAGAWNKPRHSAAAAASTSSASFQQYRRGGELGETDDDTQSESATDALGTSEEDSTENSTSEDSDSDFNNSAMKITLEPLDLVWAKCRGYPWYPALIINPNMPRTGYLHNGVPIPVPPQEVLDMTSTHANPHYLILFFDAKRTWQWLMRDKLEPLGVDSHRDKAKLVQSKKPSEKKAVKKAYEDAILHRCRVTGENASVSGESSEDATEGEADKD